MLGNRGSAYQRTCSLLWRSLLWGCLLEDERDLIPRTPLRGSLAFHRLPDSSTRLRFFHLLEARLGASTLYYSASTAFVQQPIRHARSISGWRFMAQHCLEAGNTTPPFRASAEKLLTVSYRNLTKLQGSQSVKWFDCGVAN